MPERRLDPGQRRRRVVRGDRQQDDVVRGVAVGRDLARRERVGHDPGDVRRVFNAGHGLRRGGLERRGPGEQGIAVQDHDDS